MSLDGAPSELVALADHLQAHGLAANHHPELTRTEARLLDFTHDNGLMVRMVRDEGRWSLVVGRPAWRDFFEADYWEACLSGREVPRLASPLDQQARWVEANLTRLIELGADGPLECMQLARRREAIKSMGLY